MLFFFGKAAEVQHVRLERLHLLTGLRGMFIAVLHAPSALAEAEVIVLRRWLAENG